ncbi:ERF family protein [Stappia sp.]|uniref:ERF family protein n=1 Tax=Stappia sp. TaxID=1870903 RepID=UPI003C7BB1D3
MSNAVEVMQNSGRSVQSAAGERGALTPSDMLAHAITNGAGLEVVEKLMVLQERWEAGQARKAFDDAMARMRENMPRITKDKQVSFNSTNYRYEDLDSIASAISPVLSELGLSFRWRTDNNASGVKVTCIITHRDGHYEETSLSAPVDASGNKNAMQAIGSAITYLQRYTLKAALGLSAAVDDDGHGGQDPRADERPARQERQEQQRPQQASKADSRDTYARLSKANAGLESLTAHGKFWAQDSVRKAFATLPKDWQGNLAKERDDKRAALDAVADPFGLPPVGDNGAQAADSAPINPDSFLADLRAEFEACDSLDALDEAWVFRAPEDALDFPPDAEKARALYIEHQRRLGRRA